MNKRLLIAAAALPLCACMSDSAVTPDKKPMANTAALADALPAIAPVIPMPSVALDMTEAITRISFGSCLKPELDQSIWNVISDTNADLFLYTGDNVYGDAYSEDANLPELRSAYRALAKSKPFAALRDSTPVWAIWDDHDYGLNDAGENFAFKYGAEALFEEAWALPADDVRRSRDGVHFAEIIGPQGKQVQIIMLDTRFFRSDLKQTDERGAPGKERYLPDLDPTKTILGDAQYQWLADELSKPADLRIIVSTIQVIADGHGWEAWHTLPADRQRFYDTISTSGAEHVVLISGDRHSGSFYKTDDATPYPLYEITSSSLNVPASGFRAQYNDTSIEDGPNRLGAMEYEVNFGTMDIDWAQGTATMALRDAEGKVMQDLTVNFSDLEIVN